jgi:hypothetical protein
LLVAPHVPGAQSKNFTRRSDVAVTNAESSIATSPTMLGPFVQGAAVVVALLPVPMAHSGCVDIT